METLPLFLFVLGIVWVVVRLKTGRWFPFIKGRSARNLRLPLPQRHSEIIGRIEQSISPNYHNTYYFENLTAQCLREIAQREGRPRLAPAGYLREWKARADVPTDYSELAQYLEHRFRKRHADLKSEDETKQEQERQTRFSQYHNWISQKQGLVERFLEIADRKVSPLDDYGDERWDALPKEIQTCLLKIAKSENDNGVVENQLRDAFKEKYGMPEKYDWLKTYLESEFRKFHEKRRNDSTETTFAGISGIEFETYLSRLLKKSGFESVRGTATTGDQGADLIAKKDDRIIVIQAKRYQGSVGNKAVQEVVAAVNFYGATEGWVITSGTFTSSAKALAQKNGVKLIDGYALRNGSLNRE
jgi:hypothetical protein